MNFCHVKFIAFALYFCLILCVPFTCVIRIFCIRVQQLWAYITLKFDNLSKFSCVSYTCIVRIFWIPNYACKSCGKLLVLYWFGFSPLCSPSWYSRFTAVFDCSFSSYACLAECRFPCVSRRFCPGTSRPCCGRWCHVSSVEPYWGTPCCRWYRTRQGWPRGAGS